MNPQKCYICNDNTVQQFQWLSKTTGTFWQAFQSSCATLELRGYTTHAMLGIKLAHENGFCWANSCPPPHTRNMKNPLSLIWGFGRRMDAGDGSKWLPAADSSLKYFSSSVTTLQGEPHHFQAFQPSRVVTANAVQRTRYLCPGQSHYSFSSNSKE